MHHRTTIKSSTKIIFKKTFDGSCTKHPISMHLNTLLFPFPTTLSIRNDSTARKEVEFASRVACDALWFLILKSSYGSRRLKTRIVTPTQASSVWNKKKHLEDKSLPWTTPLGYALNTCLVYHLVSRRIFVPRENSSETFSAYH